MRIGTGYDIHRLEKGKPLLLGGVKIPSEKGAVGHSDGDTLLHAITDAILGAAALGDIGQHFPDTDPKNKGKESQYFLKEVLKLVQAKGLAVENVDATIILQAPKLAEYIPAMRRQIAACLGIDVEKVSVKAKTNERLDSLGNTEGVAVHAICLLK
ncbi:MAG: 2-C-methyl-D-erythritol 2,4-cyclodiphosphate synthase [Deltaproteobacteria bacterium RIFCSPLOWO2_01_44_7]|nr:MAG: 2-C-methyl-D-erythritol 2,4-cyclodiphosphate synthase [Deltaproteobacteria bacterium RIFCSPHIGHO2_01_FULL_43_49]OGQ14728.1 MAG: 2-C-methyl-D-erythritol 2,4-cyclodiphosphate synthase [Deltaproteobacteria bacterium RIFCSPHIGHO2_02_FULL_44_53]OGQ28114.1 MAG: 2-C-methyl-D-erythritol 2,4-cyclodiphosphate synthase [Deltaproteobacteria bacterium RIFCSPHIGHO2_12_FULL_44_21]OGQ31326.1 MAG: 2-C-methyl-D-erythritol 2,4-cyclodiphosphate synthase [Deltaproteobacteria bacterium RIFCSPLOWO2_01_FULL_45_